MQKGGGPMGMMAPPIHPIDKGWAWMIVVAGFGANFFVNGCLRSTGIFVAYIIRIYQADMSFASLTVAFMAGGFALLSPVGNAVGMIFTNRVAAVIGAILIFLAFFLAVFAGSASAIIICLGLINGIGFAFEYGPSMVMVSQHFKTRMSLANGLAAAGGSVGTMLIPILIDATAQEFGFHGTLLIFSAVVLHAIPFALLLRPITNYRKNPKNKNPEVPAAGEAMMKSEGNKEDLKYELVGSQILALETPVFGSVPDLTQAKETPAVAGPQGAPPAGAAPPKMTLGMFVRIFCQRLCDKSLLTDASFYCYLFGIAFGQAGYISNLTFLPVYSRKAFPPHTFSVISVIGIADLIGRIGGGWFADLGFFKKSYILGFSFIGSGVATFFLPFFRNYAVLVGYGIVLGVLGGTYQAQMVVILVETFGPAKTPSGLGLTQLVMGIAIIPLPPILGGLAKTMGFGIVLWTCGILMGIAGILFYILPTVNQRARNKQQQAAAAAAAAATAAVS